MITFLSKKELQDLTGRKVKAKVIEWLNAHEYPFEIGGDGLPKVMSSYVCQRLSGKTNDQASATEPDFSGIN